MRLRVVKEIVRVQYVILWHRPPPPRIVHARLGAPGQLVVCLSKPRAEAFILSPHLLSIIAFTSPPSDVVVAQGSPARFDCVFTTSTTVSVSWEKDGFLIIPTGRFSYLVNNSLLISSTEAGDNGTYSCVVSDQTSQQRSERSATLSFACKKFDDCWKVSWSRGSFSRAWTSLNMYACKERRKLVVFNHVHDAMTRILSWI